jgi:hypothetical protein
MRGEAFLGGALAKTNRLSRVRHNDSDVKALWELSSHILASDGSPVSSSFERGAAKPWEALIGGRTDLNSTDR